MLSTLIGKGMGSLNSSTYIKATLKHAVFVFENKYENHFNNKQQGKRGNWKIVEGVRVVS